MIIKLKGITVELEIKKKLYLKFRYNKILLNEIKSMDGARWHPEIKKWSIKDSCRNWFQLDYLAGKDPYRQYDLELTNYNPKRQLYKHQVEMVRHALTRHFCIFACEMGTGKTLSAIEVMEASGLKNWLWVGPKSALRAVQYEMIKWGSKVTPKYSTYASLKKLIENWEGPAPEGIVFDESSKLKTPSSQRSQAALYISECTREEHPNGYVILMSGSPAPKSPVDWWHQCEVACPGFLKSGNIHKEKNRLGLVVQKESISGGVYPELKCWRDNPDKCDICGVLKEDHVFVFEHSFKKSKNEVSFLYQRMQGLVLIKMKKDCLDLPEKQYRTIKVKPTELTLRACKLIKAKSPTTIQALTLLRELSDGFQYKDIQGDSKICELCHGTKQVNIPKLMTCPHCKGVGTVFGVKRITKQVACPKEDVIIDLLEQHEDIGRIVIYAGFTGSIDRVVGICQKQGWATIRVDGRGWSCTLVGDPLKLFQNGEGKIAFVGHPGSAGMGLTLTASPTIVYYSNDFNAESRIQSEDRIHRPGCRGANIIDIVHLETDQLILDNLKKKRDLQSLTLGEININ